MERRLGMQVETTSMTHVILAGSITKQQINKKNILLETKFQGFISVQNFVRFGQHQLPRNYEAKSGETWRNVHKIG